MLNLKNASLWTAAASMVATLFVTPSAHAALTLTQQANAYDRTFERLPDLHLVRGTQLKVIELNVGASEGETWTLTADETWLQLSSNSGTGDATVELRVDESAFAAEDNPSASLVLVEDGAMTQAVTLDVNIDIWPKLYDGGDNRASLRAHVKNPANWPKDNGWGGRWALWGFLPDDESHPGQNAGVNMDTWEKTPCADGTNDDTCVGENQAGLAAGLAADQGHLLSTGDERVIIAVLDSGIHWDERDLVTKHYLNAEELRSCPPPGADADAVDVRAAFDVNEDGVFNIRDYDGAEWMTDVNKNGLRDPQDLIWGDDGDGPCSDGVDSDDNGYMDDISGWDFFWNDNDPSDDTRYGHGTGEAKDSGGEAHNFDGDTGVCPRCQILNVRVGDSFIVDVNQFADGTIFAVDSGAKVVQEALGSLNNTPYAQDAINYAYDNGVAIIASAADEASYHHNMPGSLERTLYVHAIVADTDGGWRDAATFLNFGNCTNWGGKLALSTPGTGCSSEAVGNTSGHAGLVYGYYEELRDAKLAAGENVDYWTPNLGAEELYQVLSFSADDIDVPGMEADPAALEAKRFPSNEGWDLQFGYGRNNVRRSMELLRDMKIPAEGRIDSPLWYETFNPSRTDSVDIAISLSSPRLTDLAWKLYVSPGVEGRAPVEIGSGEGGKDEEVVASLDLSSDGPLAALVAKSAELPVDQDPEAYSVTLYLETTGVNPAGETVTGGFRKVIALRDDPDVREGFPIFLGASGEGSGKLTDINGDGLDELVLPTADGFVHAFRADGTELDGFPVAVNTYPALSTELCAAEPSKCHRNSAAFASGAIDPDGVHSSMMSSIAVGDLDGDGGLCRDIVQATIDGGVFAWDCTGALREGFPVFADPAYVAEFVGALRCDKGGEEAIGCTLKQRHAETGFFASPVLDDLDGDGTLEIILAGLDQSLYVWNEDGSTENGFPVVVRNEVFPAYTAEGEIFRYDGRIVATPTVADLFGDGSRVIVVGTNERVENSTQSFLYAIWFDGSAHAGGPFPDGWPAPVAGFIPDEILPYVGRGNPNSPAAADVDGDGKDEIIVAGLGSVMLTFNEDGTEEYIMESTGTYYGPNANVDEPLGSLPVINNPSVADLDLDGRLDLINGTAGLGLIQVASAGGLRAVFDHSVSAWVAANGYFLDGFPHRVHDYQFFMNYTVADIDGSGVPNVLSGSGGYYLYAPDHTGAEAPGWPKFTSQWHITTPAVGDWDGDGKFDIVANTREGYLWAWTGEGNVGAPEGSPNPIQWAGFHHDDHNTGNVSTPIRVYDAPAPPDDGPNPTDPTCGCDASSSDDDLGAFGFAVVLLGLALVRRRRR